MDTSWVAGFSAETKFELVLVALLLVLFIYSVMYIGVRSYLDGRCARKALVRDRYVSHPYVRARRNIFTDRFVMFWKWYFRLFGI